MDKTDKLLKGFETFVNSITYLVIAMGVVGGVKHFSETFNTGNGIAWNFWLVFIWWIVISGRFSQRNALRS